MLLGLPILVPSGWSVWCTRQSAAVILNIFGRVSSFCRVHKYCCFYFALLYFYSLSFVSVCFLLLQTTADIRQYTQALGKTRLVAIGFFLRTLKAHFSLSALAPRHRSQLAFFSFMLSLPVVVSFLFVGLWCLQLDSGLFLSFSIIFSLAPHLDRSLVWKNFTLQLYSILDG